MRGDPLRNHKTSPPMNLLGRRGTRWDEPSCRCLAVEINLGLQPRVVEQKRVAVPVPVSMSIVCFISHKDCRSRSRSRMQLDALEKPSDKHHDEKSGTLTLRYIEHCKACHVRHAAPLSRSLLRRQIRQVQPGIRGIIPSYGDPKECSLESVATIPS